MMESESLRLYRARFVVGAAWLRLRWADEGVRPYTGLALGGLQPRHRLQSLQPRGGLVRLKVMIFRLLVRTEGPLFRDGKPGTLKSGRLYV